MFGSLLDRADVIFSRRRGELPSGVNNLQPTGVPSGNNWVYFLPSSCYDFRFIWNRLVFDGLNVDAYVLPKTIIQPDPELTRKFLDNVLLLSLTNQEHLSPGRAVNVLGISTGNVLAYRFAEQHRVNRLISVVPGSRLAECIFESSATRRIAEKSGRSLGEYRESLEDYNPIDSIGRIAPRSTDIYLGKHDIMIPFRRGIKLAEAMREKYGAKVHCERFSGHVGTILSFSKQFRKIATQGGH